MKKLIGLVLTSLLIAVMTACAVMTTAEPPQTTYTTATANTSTATSATLSSTVATTNWTTSRDQVEAAIIHYQELIDDVVGIDPEETAWHAAPRRLSGTYTEYLRSALQQSPVLDADQVYAEWLANASVIMGDLLMVIPFCEETDVAGFCFVSLEEMNYYVRFAIDETSLSIDLYRSSVYSESGSETIYSVSADLFLLSEVDEELSFEYVRENKDWYGTEVEHHRYYDYFRENGDMVNIALNVNAKGALYYQIFTPGANQGFLVTTGDGMLNLSYTDLALDRYFDLTYNEAKDPISKTAVFGIYNPTLVCQWEAAEDPKLLIRWNLFDVSGWDRLRIRYDGVPFLYQGEHPVLEDEYIFGVVTASVYAQLQLIRSTTVSALDDAMLRLDGEGVAYEGVTRAELLEALDYLEIHGEEILDRFGFPADLYYGYDYLRGKFPFFADPTIMRDLHNQLLDS